MKSEYNFKIQYPDGSIVDMHEIGLWIESFRIYSPNIERTLIELAGRPGALQVSSRITSRKIKIVFQIEESTAKAYDDFKHKIFSIFCHENEYKIIRDISPDTTLLAAQEGEYDIENITPTDGEFEITLIMLDPYKYGEEITIPDSPNTITNNGFAEIQPIIEIDIQRPSTYLALTTDEQTLLLGKPSSLEETPFEELTIITDDHLISMNGWVDGTTLETGVAAGTMVSSGGKFVPSGFGTGTGWHGPVKKKILTEALQDFNLQTWIEFNTINPYELGKIEIHLLDVNDQIIGTKSFFDTYKDYHDAVARYRMGRTGEYYKYVSSSRNEGKWGKQFIGRLSMQRRGDKISINTQEYDPATGRYYDGLGEEFLDVEGAYQTPVKSVQIHMAQYATYAAADMKVERILVRKINNPQDIHNPYIFRTGDKVIIDNQTKKIFLNGEQRIDLKDLSSNYLEFKKGNTNLNVFPYDVGTYNVKYREKGV
jgi:predicted phage tail component-like protein